MLPTPDQSLKTIEDKFALKLDALQAQILQTQLASEDYGRQFLGLRSEIQTLVQRLSETESATQQTHALMVNECGQEAQWRDGLRSEHESLRAQVAAIQPNDNALRALEEGFQREIGALEDRLIQKWRLLEQQDADLRELKAQFQNFAQQSNPADAVLPVSPVTPFAPTVAVPVDISALRAQREASSVGSIKAQPQSVVVGPVDNQEPSETLSNVNRDQLKQLQERLSADIERARNELREKSGRWKVRR
jgi:DNA repair exonuclease SbcCD ATPase subunit